MSAVKFTLTKDTLTPAIRRLLALGKDTTPVMRAMGTTFKSITEGTFNSVGAGYRPRPWPPKKDGSPSNLQLTTTMSKSFHLTVSKDRATLSNPMPYAAVHQFGSRDYGKSGQAVKDLMSSKAIKRRQNIPPRPFYPVVDGKLTPKASELIAAAAKRAISRLISGSSGPGGPGRDPLTGRFTSKP